MEFLVAWYSGSESELDGFMQVHLALQVLVDLAALVLAWRSVGGPCRGAACSRAVEVRPSGLAATHSRMRVRESILRGRSEGGIPAARL